MRKQRDSIMMTHVANHLATLCIGSNHDFNSDQKIKMIFDEIRDENETLKDYYDILGGWDIDVQPWDEKKQLNIVYSIYKDLNFYEQFKINHDDFCGFLLELSMHYNKYSNPFHNFKHGINVCHSCYWLYKNSQLKNYLNPLQTYGFVTSGQCHDVGHTGRTNAFEINIISKLSIRYHDNSPQEQMHAAQAFKIMLKRENNILSGLTGPEFKNFRKNFVKNILATDMKSHTDLQKEFKVECQDKKVDEKSEEQAQLISSLFTHVADLSGPVKDYNIAYKWSKKVNIEFSTQVEEEMRLNLPVTPYFKDLDDTEVYYKNELGFMKFVILPLWKCANDFQSNSIDFIVEQTNKNIKIMEEKLKVVQAWKEKGKVWVDFGEEIEFEDEIKKLELRIKADYNSDARKESRKKSKRTSLDALSQTNEMIELQDNINRGSNKGNALDENPTPPPAIVQDNGSFDQGSLEDYSKEGSKEDKES